MASAWKPKRCLRPIRSKPHVRREGLLKRGTCFICRFSFQIPSDRDSESTRSWKEFSSRMIALMGQELLYELCQWINQFHLIHFMQQKLPGWFCLRCGLPLWLFVISTVFNQWEHWSCCFIYTHRQMPYSKTTSLHRH